MENVFSSNASSSRFSTTSHKHLVEAKTSVTFHKSVQDEFGNDFKGFLSLDSNDALSSEVVDMAEDFHKFVEDAIYTGVHIMTIQVTEKSGSKPLKLTTLSNTWNTIMKMVPGNKNKFTRYQKINVLYLPAFNSDIGANSKGEITLIDDSVINQKDQIIQGVTFVGNRMALSELSMNFSVLDKNSDHIKIKYRFSNVPVKGRAFCTLILLFHVHNEFINKIYEKNIPKCIYLDDIQMPKNLNVKNIIQEFNKSIEKKLEKRERQVQKKASKMVEKDVSEYMIQNKSEQELNMISSSAIENTDFSVARESEEIRQWYLDSGASQHILVSERSSKCNEMILPDGKKIKGYLHKELMFYIQNDFIKLLNVFETSEVKKNILSLGSLQQSGFFDSIKTEIIDEKTSTFDLYLSGKLKLCAEKTDNNLYLVLENRDKRREFYMNKANMLVGRHGVITKGKRVIERPCNSE
uniref:Movement protein n=1 Tax=Pseudolycopodiella ophiovirus TaxID=2983955 RepID=A0A9N6YJQ2_9VIRU|nr:TPA_asm: movement protein [Pseudolycopodiella ophiovirus]